MKLRRLFAPFLLFAFANPLCGQVQSRSEVDSLLQASNKALDHYQHLAPGIHCDEATKTEFRDACKIGLETLQERVQEAKAKIARCRQSSTPQAVDLFDTYEVFRRVMIELEALNSVPDFYGERNQQLFAEAYNTFVKITGWFGGVVRDSIRDADKCSDRVGHT
jgi:hypothetical protein